MTEKAQCDTIIISQYFTLFYDIYHKKHEIWSKWERMSQIEKRTLNKIFENEEICIELDHTNAYIDTTVKKHENSHIHSCCEIYFNIEGDVSFAVENKVYKINKEEIFIAKPNEFHNCVYHTSGKHQYYCLWLTAKNGFEKYLSPFFLRKNADGNHIVLNEECKKLFKKALEEIENQQQKGSVSSIKTVSSVFDILNILSEQKSPGNSSVRLPGELTEILNYIDSNFSKDCSVNTISKKFFLSRSKINRLFKENLNTTPTKYVESRRLSKAKILLEDDLSVQKVCEECGFPDYSHFIALFKKRFGITPLKYKKALIK